MADSSQDRDRSRGERRQRRSGAHLNGDAPRHARRRRRRGVVVGIVTAAVLGVPACLLLVTAVDMQSSARPWVGVLLAGVALACLPVAAGVATATRRVGGALFHGLWSGCLLSLLTVAAVALLP